MVISEFQKIFLDPPIKNEFFRNCLIKSEISKIFNKKCDILVSCRHMSHHLACKILTQASQALACKPFNSISLLLAYIPIAKKKNVSDDEIIFQIAILSISRPRTEIKMPFLESWGQSDPEHTTCIKKFHFENLTSYDQRLTWPWFALGQIAK